MNDSHHPPDPGTLEAAAHAIMDSPTTEAMLRIFCTEAANRNPAVSGGLLLNSDSGDYAVLTGVWNAGRSWIGGLSGMRRHHDDPEADACLATLETLPPHRRMTVPLRSLGMNVGELRLWLPGGGPPEPGEVSDIRLLSVMLAAGMAGIRLQSRMRGSSVRDPVTGLYNRRYLEDTLPRECHRCARERRPLSVLHVDLDGFGQYNARHGRHEGDRLLQAVAGLIQIAFRGSDVACRLGGGQFLIALPEASLDNAVRRGNDLLSLIRDLRVDPHRVELPGITASIGVAAYPVSADDPGELLAAADSARLLACGEGGDQVRAAERIE